MIQREVRLNGAEHTKFCRLMDEKLSHKNMTYQDLANEIGVSIRSIYNFRKDTSREPSKFLAGKIATYLDINPKDYKSKTSFFGMVIPFVLALLIPMNVHAETIPNIPITEEEQIQIQEICESKNISFALIMAMMEKESCYDREAVNKNCKGVLQINPKFFDIENPFDVIESVDVATDWLCELREINPDVSWALDVYSGNPNADSNYERGIVSRYSKKILERSAEIELEIISD